MRYFIDTEFIERGAGKPIDLVSIGIVAQDGRELYAVSTDFNPKHASQWVKENVLTKLPDRNVDSYDSPRRRMEACAWMPREEIARRLLVFVGNDPAPEFWGWACGFDYVLACQLIGFDRWPDGWPYYFADIQQEADRIGFDISDMGGQGNHEALADARHIRAIYETLRQATA